MQNRDTLFFLPDISGFTSFVNNVDISHSKHIIAELLEAVMSKNKLKFDLGEIEGDALFYYSKNNLPSFDQVLAQAKEMFLAFHQQLLLYDNRRICNCGACSSAVNLSLKFIIHYGESELISIGGRNLKPFGKDVILAHRLLKNTLPTREYILFTDTVEKENMPSWFTTQRTTETIDGEQVKIYYADINSLLNEVPEIPELQSNHRAPNPIIVEGYLDAKPEDIYELLSNMDLRELWNKKVDKLEYNKDRINRIGDKHLCVIDGRTLEFETLTENFGNKSLVYGEVTKNIPVVKTMTNYFILQKKGEQTFLRIESHFKPLPIIGFLLTPFIRKMVKKEFEETINQLKTVAQTNFLIPAAPL
ncbi:MAG: hypothetical protein ACI9A7_000310 [Cyclobacteriaceae bacterium]|jgi:hypothetical protein